MQENKSTGEVYAEFSYSAVTINGVSGYEVPCTNKYECTTATIPGTNPNDSTKPVIKIADWAFSNSSLTPFTSNLKTVYISENIKEIGQGAFKLNKNLESVVLPDSLQEIKDEVFMLCSNLKTVSFGKNSELTHLWRVVFAYCTSLTNFVCPSKLTYIGDNCFAKCTNLKNIYLNNGLSEILDQAFIDSGIETLKIPKTVMSLSNGALWNTHKLKDVYFDYDNNDLDSIIQKMNNGMWNRVFGSNNETYTNYSNAQYLKFHISDGSLLEKYQDTFKEYDKKTNKGVGIDSKTATWIVDKDLNLGAILGGIFGAIAFFGLMSSGIIWFKRKRNKGNKK